MEERHDKAFSESNCTLITLLWKWALFLCFAFAFAVIGIGSQFSFGALDYASITIRGTTSHDSTWRGS